MKQDVEVTVLATVTVDEAKFTPEFMAEFREHFYPFQTIDDHIGHIAFLVVCGKIQLPCFIEGYGNSDDFGIMVEV